MLLACGQRGEREVSLHRPANGYCTGTPDITGGHLPAQLASIKSSPAVGFSVQRQAAAVNGPIDYEAYSKI